MYKNSLFFIFFLIAPGVQGFSMEEPVNMGSFIIPVELDVQDLYWDLVPGEQIYVRIDYVTRPGGEVLFSEPSEQIWWLKEKPVLFLGSTGESLPSEVMSRKQVFIEVLWDDEPLLSEPVLLFLNEDKVEVSRDGSGKETLEKALGKRLVSVDASYIAQVANYMVGNVATLDIRGDSMTIQQNGSIGGTLMTSGLTTQGFSMGTGAASGKVLTSDVNGVASWADPSGSSSLTLPYSGSGASTQSDNLFTLLNNGVKGSTADFYSHQVSNTDPTVNMDCGTSGQVLSLKTSLHTNPQDTLHVSNYGRGNAGYFRNHNTDNDLAALHVFSEGPGIALDVRNSFSGSSHGEGVAATFDTFNENSKAVTVKISNNSDTGGDGLWVTHSGASGYASHFETQDSANTKPAILVKTYGTGPAIRAQSFNNSTVYNKGNAAHFESGNYNSKGSVVLIESGSTSSDAIGLDVRFTGSFGNAGYFQSSSTEQSHPTLVAEATGHSPAMAVSVENATSGSYALSVRNKGIGNVASFETTKSSNAEPTLYVLNNGQAQALEIANIDTSNPSSVIRAEHYGLGSVGIFENYNVANPKPTLVVNNAGTSSAVEVNSAGTSSAVVVNNSGSSIALDISNMAVTNTATALGADHFGLGSSGSFTNYNTSNSEPVIKARSYGTGVVIKASTDYNSSSYTTGQAAVLETTNSGTSADTLAVTNNGVGDTVAGYSKGSGGHAGYFSTSSSANTSATIRVVSGYSSAAAKFEGDVAVIGTLSKSAGSFKIDHPLDPENKTLSHSFVESPDMMNIYNGNTILDGRGEAWIELPEWFEALNRDYRYQLTTMGGGALVYIKSKLADNQFQVAGGYEGLEVSWQITGIRQDAYATQHPIVVEQDKAPDEKGYYLTPEAHGFEKTRQIGYQKNSRKEQ